jgi:hypothetical protein
MPLTTLVLRGCGEGLTGNRKKDRSLKEKIVVPVVQVGKVGNLPMWLGEGGLARG